MELFRRLATFQQMWIPNEYVEKLFDIGLIKLFLKFYRSTIRDVIV